MFIECWKEGLYFHGFTHDLSKFRPSEFMPYARYFYGDYISNTVLNNVSCIENKSKIKTKEIIKEEFERAWELHYKRNKHHWNHWIICNGEILIDMPEKYIKQMICDWKGMARKFGGTAQEFYMKNYDKIQLTRKSRLDLEFELGLIDGVALISNMIWKDYCENIGITMEEDLRQLGYIK